MMRATKRVWIASAVVVGLIAAGCSSGGSDDEGAATTAPDQTTTTEATAPIEWPAPTFVEGECPMPLDEVELEVTCGTVDVPEDRLDPDSRTISLAVARIHSAAPDAAPDPVVQLEGGPGFPSLEDVAGFSRSAVLDSRDYVLWDQRGTGFSSPNLDCTETNDAVWEVFSTTDEPVEEYALIEESLRACRERITADGTDLDGYDTTQNAADLADLRVALGIDEWNLRGISYGSALAIETVRNHPEGIRSVLLDSIVPPDAPFGAIGRGESALRAFGELYDACAADEACAETYGDLEALFTEAADRLDEDPHETSVLDPATGRERAVSITGRDLWAGLFNALYDETLIPALPAAAQAIAGGDNSIIDLIAEDGIPFAAGQHEGMTASVSCADRAALLDPEVVAPFAEEHPELGALVYLTVPETGCAEWDVEPAADGFNDLLEGDDVDVPVLVMAGRFDPITPPEGSRRVAEALGQELLLFPDAGHGAVSSSACARDLWLAFLDDPSSDPDTSCMDELGPPDFS
jgi:pimeloyl-ACP methyl ester carboxylesterase